MTPLSAPLRTCCSLQNDPAGDAAFAAAVLWLVGVVVAALVDDEGAPGDIGQLEVGRRHGLVDAFGRGLESRQVALVTAAFGTFVRLGPVWIVVLTGRHAGR